MKFTAQRTILKSMAQPKLATINPGINELTRRTISPLMTKVNNPKVIKLNGKVKRRTIGLIKVLTIPSPMATIIAVTKLSTDTPDNR